MGLFGLLKKNEETGHVAASAYLGVLEMFSLEKTDQLLIIGQLKGSLKTGDRLQICNPDGGFNSLGKIEIEKLSTKDRDVDVLTDEPLAHITVNRSDKLKNHLKKGSVLHTPDIDEEKLVSAYTDALYTAFVRIQAGEMSNDDYLRASLDDSIEILRLFLWACRQNQEDENEERYQEELRKIADLEEIVRDKLFEADSVYAVYSQLTGEPYMFSKTLDRGEAGYLCTDPVIQLMTHRWYEHFRDAVDNQPGTEVKKVENTADKEGIKNFLGSAFYLNGAMGIFLNSDDVRIQSHRLVEAPNFTGLPEVEKPIMNPDIVRWLLLMGQLDELDTKNKELIYRLYYGFFSRELPKARLLIPMKTGQEFPEKNLKTTETVLKQGASFQLPTRQGKDGREAIALFTDWKRLRMVFDEEWSGMIEPAGNMISMVDYILNGTQYPKAGCYVSQESFKTMTERFSGK